MRIRKIPSEEFVKFVIEEGLKKVPELVDKYPVETMYKRLNRNIQKVVESREKDLIYSAYYSRDDDAVCIVNSEDKFDLEALKENKGNYHSAIHESIHALISKLYLKNNKPKSIPRKILNYAKNNTFYLGIFLRSIDKKKDFPIKAYGIMRENRRGVRKRNIKGFFEGDSKYKYKGSLISRFFRLKNSFSYRSDCMAIGLEEGFVEWLTNKISDNGVTYKNEFEIIKQIENVLGPRKTIDIADGNLYEIRKMLEMDKNSFYTLIYKMDEALRATYRRDIFEKQLEILKRNNEESEQLDFIEKVKKKIDLAKTDLLFYSPKKLDKVQKARAYYKEVIHENLSSAEEILIDSFLLPNAYKFLNKDELEFDDIRKVVKMFELIREFSINSEVSQSRFLKTNSYKNFRKVFKEVGNRFFVQFKDKLEEFTPEQLECAYDWYDHFEESDVQGEFYQKLEECKSKYFYKNIFPEVQEKFKKGKKLSFEEIDEYVNSKGVLLKEDVFWKFLLGKDLTEEEIWQLSNEKALYIEYGYKFNKENLVKNPYSDEYDIVVNNRYLGKIKKIYAEMFLQDKNYFSEDRFFLDSNLNIDGLISYDEYLQFLQESRDNSAFETERMLYSQEHSSTNDKQKLSFKNLLSKILRKKEIDICDIEDVSLKINEEEK